MSARFLIATIIISLLPVVPAMAKDNCKAPQTQMDMNVCSDIAYKKADKDLNAVYQKALKKIQENDPSKVESFKAVQREWMKFRDLNCKFVADEYEGGSIRPLMHSSCLEKITIQRTEQIPGLFAEWE